jgi:hypothetical protein
MNVNGLLKQARGARATIAAVSALVLGGCLQSAPVVVTPQEQQSRVVYSCPDGKSIDVTRLSNGASAIVLVDGQTVQLNRDAASTSAERYTNRIQTLTVYGGSATYETLGLTRRGPCTASEYGGPGGEGRESNRRTKQENTD